MRHFHLIGIIALLALGYGIRASETVNPQSEALTKQQTADQTNTTLMVGTWDFSFPDGEPNMRIQLGKDGHWKWWVRSSEPPPATNAAINNGTWFIHEGTLFVRIEQTNIGKIPEGWAFTLDIVSVSPDKALLVSLHNKREVVTWTRVL